MRPIPVAGAFIDCSVRANERSGFGLEFEREGDGASPLSSTFPAEVWGRCPSFVPIPR